MTHLPPYLRPLDRPLVASVRPALPIRDLPSPNQDARPAGAPIDTLVLHASRMKTVGEAVARLRDPSACLSVHYVVDEDGSVLRLVPEDRRAWHTGSAHWRGYAGLDGRSIGITVVNQGHAGGEHDFPVLQTAALCDLCLLVLARHPIPPRNVVAQGDVAPDRAGDPHERFDWQGLADNGVGLWPGGVPDLGTTGGVRDALGLRPVRAALDAIGYRVAPEGALDPALSAVLRAFQRHWRPEAITGQADDGTLVRLQAVLRLIRDG